MSDEAWRASKRHHASIPWVVRAEGFVLYRLVLDGDAPLPSEVELVSPALIRPWR